VTGPAAAALTLLPGRREFLDLEDRPYRRVLVERLHDGEDEQPAAVARDHRLAPDGPSRP
jgi:hypothetical protein